MPKETPEHLGPIFLVKGGMEGMNPEVLCSTGGSPGSRDAVWTGISSGQGLLDRDLLQAGAVSRREWSLERDTLWTRSLTRQG